MFCLENTLEDSGFDSKCLGVNKTGACCKLSGGLDVGFIPELFDVIANG